MKEKKIHGACYSYLNNSPPELKFLLQPVFLTFWSVLFPVCFFEMFCCCTTLPYKQNISVRPQSLNDKGRIQALLEELPAERGPKKTRVPAPYQTDPFGIAKNSGPLPRGISSSDWLVSGETDGVNAPVTKQTRKTIHFFT